MKKSIFAAALAALLFLAPGLCRGQVSTAGINGAVTDPQGSVIPGAELVLTNVETGIVLRSETTAAGLYRFQNIQVGRYTLQASAEGFSTQLLEEFTLTVNQQTTLDFSLEVGAVTETVEVQAAAVQLQSSSAELGQQVEEKQVRDLPLNGRNFTQMLMLNPGTVMVRPRGSQSLSYTRPVGEAANPSVNGQNNRTNVFMLDGVANFETFGNAYAVPPILDAIQEFKVQSHNDQAETAMGSGGTVNVVTKSGTNELHGTVWYFHKNDAFNARQFNLAKVNPFKQHQYGATAGGPIVRNKTFFFGAFQGYRFTRPAQRFYNVPSAAMLGGDFQDAGRGIFDPASTRVGAGGLFVRDPFVNNRIPSGRIDQSMVDYLRLTNLPQPKQTARPDFNAVDTRNNTIDQEEWQVKVDHHFSAKDMVWFRYSTLDQRNNNTGGREGLVLARGQQAVNMAASWVHIVGPTSTFQVQFGRSYSDIPSNREFLDIDAEAVAQQVGIPSGILQYRDGPVLSGISAGAYFGGTPIISTNRPADNWQLKGNFSKIVGSHTFKVGFDFMKATMRRTQASHGSSFAQFETADLQNTAATGDSIASLLLNAVNSSSRRNILESLRFAGNMGIFVQDSWKVNQKLTVNLGMRFDRAWVPQYGTEEDGNIFTGNANTDTGQYAILMTPGPCSQVGGAPCIPTADGSLPENVFSVNGGDLIPGRGNMLGPRVGLAYRLTDKTTLRASGGIVYDNWAGIYQSARGIGGNWPDVSVTRFGNLNSPTASNLFPGVGAFDPSLGQSDVPAPNPFNTQWWFVDPEFEQAYSMQWNFGVQHQLADSTVVEVNYVGSGGRDLSLGGRRNTAVTPGPGDPQDRMRFPYMRPTFFEKSIGRNNYNALQFSLKRSFSDGLAATVAYTYGKSIDIGCSGFFGTEGCSIQNEYDLNGQRSISANDITHNFVMSFVYELPFGKGAMDTGSPGVNAIVSGWQFNGLINFRQGLPYNVVVPGDLANIFNPGTYLRPNLVGNPRKSNPTPEQWIDPGAFAAPSNFTFGNMGRNTLRPDAVYRFDLSLFRRFPITERAQFEIRLETFNAFNSTMFEAPQFNLTNLRFGLVTNLQVPPREIQIGAKIIF